MRMKARAVGRPVTLCLMVVTVAIALAACGSSKSGSGSSSGGSGGSSSSANAAPSTGLYGTLPSAGTPTYILPIVPAASASVYNDSEFQTLMYPALYATPQGKTPTIDYGLSIGQKPTFSDGDKTVTVKLNPNYKWANGAPVDAQDVIFDVDLSKAAVAISAANLAAYSPGLYPQNIRSMSAPSKDTVVFHLTKKFNPSFFTETQLIDITPLPSTDWNVDSAGGKHLSYTSLANAKKIYSYLNKQAGSLQTFGTSKLWKDADGPYVIQSFNTTNSTWTMKANPAYGGSPKPTFATVNGEVYTGATAMISALKSGSLDIGDVDTADLGQVGSLRSAGLSVYGYPDLGWIGAFINFKDQTNHFGDVAKQLYFRQALAHLENQPAYVKGILHGAGGAAYGPVPAVPVTPYTPKDAVNPPYAYSVSTAKSLLSSHGWKIVPNGTDTCQKPGTGAGECGAGIPAGTPLKFNWIYLNPQTQAFQSLESESIESLAKTIGINIQLSSKAFTFMVNSYNDANPASTKYQNQWGVSFFGGYTDDIYPTQNSIYNTGGSYNQGAYSSSQADKLINQSVYSSNPSAVSNEASFLTKDVPALFFPNPDLVYAVSKKIGGSPDAFLDLTQYSLFPQLMYVKK